MAGGRTALVPLFFRDHRDWLVTVDRPPNPSADRKPCRAAMRLLMNTLVQQAQYDLAHVHADRIKLKRLEFAL